MLLTISLPCLFGLQPGGAGYWVKILATRIVLGSRVAVSLGLLCHKPSGPRRHRVSSPQGQDGATAVLQKYLEMAR